MGFLFGWAISTYVSYSGGKRNTRLTMQACLLCTCDRVTTRILHPVPPRLLNPLMSFPFVQQKVTAADRGVWLCGETQAHG